MTEEETKAQAVEAKAKKEQEKKDKEAKAKAAKVAEDKAKAEAEIEAIKIAAAQKSEEKVDEIIVGDPQELRPKDLPLVVKPAKGGKWKNDEQTEFAATLNAYAYRNQTKWAEKKEVLIAQLAEIGKNPKAITKYRGNTGKVSYSNKMIEN